VVSRCPLWVKSGHDPQVRMTDIEATQTDVRFVPKADIPPFIQLVASFTRELVGKANWNSDPILPSDDAVS
jgi:hypothetical protein